jgi:hypothetical protein
MLESFHCYSQGKDNTESKRSVLESRLQLTSPMPLGINSTFWGSMWWIPSQRAGVRIKSNIKYDDELLTVKEIKYNKCFL